MTIHGRRLPVDRVRAGRPIAQLRTKVTQGAGSPAPAVAMVFKPVEPAQARWRATTGAHLAPLVRAGAKFENGALVAREELVA
ncbi:hypothetical protein [Peterkaempfera sp. SMS 1(5)a]